MENSLSAERSIIINAPAVKVWSALTDPAMIAQYFFGTEVKSGWKVGSSITFSGEWQGKHYEDKGVITKCEPNKILQYAHYSPLGGEADLPENYHLVTCAISGADGAVTLTITQDNNKTEAMRDHSNTMWENVLMGIKRLLEAQPA